MNCSACRAVLTELARPSPSLIDAEQEYAALAHTTECPECARHSQNEQSLTGALAAWAAEPVAPSDAIWNRLADHPVPKARPSRVWPVAAVAAAAAVVVIGVVAWKPTGPPEPSARIRSAKPPVLQANQAKPVTPVRVPRKRRARRPVHPNVAAPTVAPEIATSFIPVAFATADDPPEGQLVRVKLPRPALASFGLLMNPDENDQPIKADVLLATDGTVRAIRFVQ